MIQVSLSSTLHGKHIHIVTHGEDQAYCGVETFRDLLTSSPVAVLAMTRRNNDKTCKRCKERLEAMVKALEG